MTAAPALIAHVAPAMDQPVLLALTAVVTETLRPARLLQRGLAILLGAVQLDELGQSCLKLASIHGHGKHTAGTCVPVQKGAACLRSLPSNQ